MNKWNLKLNYITLDLEILLQKTEIAKLMKVLSLFNVLKNDCCFKCLSDYIGLCLKCITENVKYSF